jgi:hypothetical protein
MEAAEIGKLPGRLTDSGDEVAAWRRRKIY